LRLAALKIIATTGISKILAPDFLQTGTEELMATRPAQTTWLVTRQADQITPGDQVFLWRAIGNGEETNSGVVAEARVIKRNGSKRRRPGSPPFLEKFL
jgi:hypothetical protein